MGRRVTLTPRRQRVVLWVHLCEFTEPAPRGHRRCLVCGQVCDWSASGPIYGRQYGEQLPVLPDYVYKRLRALERARQKAEAAGLPAPVHDVLPAPRRSVKDDCPTPQKPSHRTREAAVEQALHMSKANRGTPFRAYGCVCGRFHVTHWSLEKYERHVARRVAAGG
jgi:hypothetical protein